MSITFKNLIKSIITSGLIGQSPYIYLHRLALIGMDYGVSGDFRRSGELNILKSIVEPALEGRRGIVFDVGANTGEYLVEMARLLPPGTHIYGFEPVTSMYRELEDRVYMTLRVWRW